MDSDEEQLFGGQTMDLFNKLDELDSSNEIADDDDDSNFDNEPLDSSSSDDEEIDNDYNFIDAARQCNSKGVRSRTGGVGLYHSTSEESVVSRDIPDWFQDKPFLYNGRVAVLAIPGSTLVLLFSGEMMLTVLAIGSILIYLLHNSGHSERATLVYIATFVVLQLTVIYSILPLLWKSVLNVVIILALNTYTFLTGGWIMLLIQPLRLDDADLLLLIEASLFTVYPAVFVVVITWVTAVMTSISVSPYVFLLLGFIVLQVFLSPTMSSFIKPHAQGSLAVWDVPHGYILDCDAIACIAFMYAISCPALVLTLRFVTTDLPSFLSLATLIQTLFVSALSLFLSTFLHLRLFLDKHEIPVRYLQIVRWSAAVVALILVSPYLMTLNVSSTLLPWIPLWITFYVCLLIASLRRIRAGIIASLNLLLFLGLVVFYGLPWHLQYDIAEGYVSLTTAEALILFNLSLSLLAVYAALYWNNEKFGLAVIIQALCYCVAARILLVSGFISFLILAVSTLVHTYMFLRLEHAGKLTSQHGWLLLTIHWTTLLLSLDAIASLPGHASNVTHLYDVLSTTLAVAGISQVLTSQRSELMPMQEFLKNAAALTCLLILNAPILLRRILNLSFGSNLTHPVSAYIGVIGLTWGILLIKAACFNCMLPVTLSRKHVLIPAMVIPLLMLTLQPRISSDSEEIRKWLVLLGTACAMIIVPLTSVFKSALHIIGLAVGIPLAFSCVYVLFPNHSSLSLQISVSSLSALCFTLLLVVWQQTANSDRLTNVLGVLICVISALITLLETLLRHDSDPSIALYSSAIATLLTSVVLHVKSKSNSLISLDPSVRRSRFSLTGNVATLQTFVIFSLSCPTPFVKYLHLWICLSSLVLLLLNPDRFLLSDLKTHSRWTPVAIATSLTLYITVLYHSVTHIYHTTPGGAVISFLSIVELIALLSTVPVILTLWKICWCNKYWWSDRYIVFIAPVYILFLYVGSTCASYTLTVYGIAVCYWLICYRLPLEVERL